MISYVLDNCHLSGGAKVVFEHVRGLRDRGHDAQVLYRSGSPAWFTPSVPAHRLYSSDALAQVRGIKVATWCETAHWVARSLRDGDAGYYLVQDIDEMTYLRKAPVTYDLGLHHIVEGRWVEKQLQSIGVSSSYVGIGTRYQHVAGTDCERFRIFAQYRPRSGHHAGDLKGWSLTLEAVKIARDMDRRISLVTFGMSKGPRLPMPHIHITRPSDAKLAELYSQAGVFLFTSRHEGFGLPGIEAMACGCPVVCTPADGNEEYSLDGKTALVRRDATGLAEACVKIMHDPKLMFELETGGYQMSNNYRWPAVIDKLEAIYARRSLAVG